MMAPHSETTYTSGVSVIVPAFRSAATLPELIEQLARSLPFCAKQYEVILVSDGSPDSTWEVIRQLSTRYPWVRGIHLIRNYGQHNAVLCGLRAARFDVAVTMDDDLQHPPGEIPKLLAKLDEGHDVVYGSPESEQHGIVRDVASVVTKWFLQGAMGEETARSVSAFRALRSRILRGFDSYVGPQVNIDVLLTWGTRQFAAVRVKHQPRRHGKSNYGVRQLVTHAMNMVTGFSSLPLQLASAVGFTFTLFGVAMFVFVIGRYLIQGGSVPGFTFLAAAIAILAGAQLFALGMIGEYLSRMHFRMMDKPCYVVREETPVVTQEDQRLVKIAANDIRNANGP